MADWQVLKERYAGSHSGLLKMVEDLSDEQLAWRPTPTAHNIAFQVWHAARSADDIQKVVSRACPSVRNRLGEGREIWQAEGLAANWGLDPATLGAGESGYDMDDAAAARLTLPGKPLLDYARRAFDALNQALDAAAPDEWNLPYKHWGTNVPLWQHVVDYLSHNEWNVGYIAALRRAQDLSRVIA